MKKRIAFAFLAVAAPLGTLPATASAQIADDWEFQAIIYGHLPDIRGSSTFVSEIGRDGITVDANNIISNLKFAFMGTFAA